MYLVHACIHMYRTHIKLVAVAVVAAPGRHLRVRTGPILILPRLTCRFDPCGHTCRGEGERGGKGVAGGTECVSEMNVEWDAAP